MTSLNVYAQAPEDRGERKENDFYPTEPEATVALLRAEAARLAKIKAAKGLIWEPACGDGAIAKVLQRAGFLVMSTDLIDRGFGHAPIDFLGLTREFADLELHTIITNPPFGDLAQAFIEHAHYLQVGYIAMLLKAHYFHAQCRIAMRRRLPLARVYPLGWRLDFTGEGSPHTDCSWYIWDREHAGQTLYMDTLEKPLDVEQRDLFIDN